MRPEQWHVTVRFLGEVEDHLFPTLTEALERAVTTVPGPVHCAIGPATAWFSGGRVLQIPATGLEDVAGTVQQATVPLIPDAGEAPFIGHLTVGRVRGRRADPSTVPAVAGLAFTAEFDVRHLLLVASAPSPGGPHYTTLAQFALPT